MEAMDCLAGANLMKAMRWLAFVIALSLSGCGLQERHYRQNLATVRVPRWVKLSQPDREALVRLVSHATSQDIVGITGKGAEFTLYTGTNGASSSQGFRAYSVAKRGGAWHIVSYGAISPSVISMLLSIEAARE